MPRKKNDYYTPTPEQIKDACRIIQAGWSSHETAMRGRVDYAKLSKASRSSGAHAELMGKRRDALRRAVRTRLK